MTCKVYYTIGFPPFPCLLQTWRGNANGNETDSGSGVSVLSDAALETLSRGLAGVRRMILRPLPQNHHAEDNTTESIRFPDAMFSEFCKAEWSKCMV